MLLDDASAQLIREFGNRVSAIADYKQQREFADEARRVTLGSQDMRVYEPSAYSLAIAMEIMVMRSRGKDAYVVDALSGALDALAGAHVDDEPTAIGILSGVVSDWRAGKLSNDRVFGRVGSSLRALVALADERASIEDAARPPG
jgi:hypothetical protein